MIHTAPKLEKKSDQRVRVSKALWIPTLWLFFAGSRPVSLWLQLRMVGTGADDQLEGSPLDRAVWELLILCALVILIARGRKIGNLLRGNGPILLFLLYCGMSIFWSDFPDVAFKRWIRGVGDIAMVAVVLTDPAAELALEKMLTRVGILILPASIVSDLVRGHLGLTYHAGVTTNKNIFGMISMILGLAAFWRFLRVVRSSERKGRGIGLMFQGSLLLMAAWCLWTANSATSLACFLLGMVIILATDWWSLKPAVLHLVIAAMLFAVVYATVLNPQVGVVSTMGKDPTLTGRTDVWRAVIPMNPSPLVGAGFESFWLGQRLKELWSIFPWKPNEAHDGYIEIYLNLGWIGLALLGVVSVMGYRKVIRHYKDSETGTLKLAYFVMALAYSVTEAGLRIFNPVWIMFLTAIIVIPQAAALVPERAGAKRPQFGTAKPLEVLASRGQLEGMQSAGSFKR